MNERPDHLIDVVKIARSRKGGDRIPGFVLSMVKRFIHQDFLNSFFIKGLTGAEFCAGAVETLDIKVNVKGLENLIGIPSDKHCTVVSNHPLGGIDGVVMLNLLLPHFDGRLRLLANDFLMALKGLAPLCIPVNKLGGQARNLPAAIKEMFDSENEILMFPAGQCSRRYNGKIQDCEWKKTFVRESIRSGRYILPVHFKARNSWRFYFVDGLCRFLGIKFNFPMFMLPDEMVRGRGKSVEVIIGKPIAPESLDSSKTHLQWAQSIREQVYNL